jgi:stage V sporulation protein B
MNSPKTSSQSIGSWLSPRKRAFITGTLLLTGTGFLCRVLGFFYRIFMSRAVGAEGLGIYNMVHPVFGICFAVCAGSIQTALSQYEAGPGGVPQRPHHFHVPVRPAGRFHLPVR